MDCNYDDYSEWEPEDEDWDLGPEAGHNMNTWLGHMTNSASVGHRDRVGNSVTPRYRDTEQDYTP